MGKTIAGAAIIGAVTIALADAPDWDINTFAGWLAAMTALAFIGQFAPEVATALTGLLLAVLILGERGRIAIDRLGTIVGAGR